jgi:hypothetical protein
MQSTSGRGQNLQPGRPPGRPRQRQRPKPSDTFSSEKRPQAPRRCSQGSGVYERQNASQPPASQAVHGSLANARYPGTGQVPVPEAIRQEGAFRALALSGGVVVVGVMGGRARESAQLLDRVLQKQVGSMSNDFPGWPCQVRRKYPRNSKRIRIKEQVSLKADPSN